jgi:hypothetical protein
MSHITFINIVTSLFYNKIKMIDTLSLQTISILLFALDMILMILIYMALSRFEYNQQRKKEVKQNGCSTIHKATRNVPKS